MMKKHPFDDESYLRFCKLIRARTGILVGENRREVLASALRECAESMACADLDRLFSCLQDTRTDSKVWDDLIKKVTIGETYFFRDSDYIEALRCNILPDLLARHQSNRTLRLWSAGCATGEEPYTLAILLRQILSDIDQWKILILATDINRHALSLAAASRYRAWSFRETDPAIRSTYFTPNGDTFTLEPVIRNMVSFAYHNLAEDNYPSPINQTSDLDLILCRNVTIYLPKSLIHDIANRFYQCLSNGGWLMVGPSETHLEIYRQFQAISFRGATAYQRVSGMPASPNLWTAAPEPFDRSVVHLQPDSLPVEPRPQSPCLRAEGGTSTQVRYLPLRPSAVASRPNADTFTPSAEADGPSAPAPGSLPSATVLQSSIVGKPLPASFHSSTHDLRVVDPSEGEISITNPEAASEQHQPLYSKTGPGSAERASLYQQGEAFMKRHRYDEARQCFLACLTKETGSTSALYRLACLEANVGQLNEARKWAEQALGHDPLRSEVHYTLALIHHVQGELQEAINRLKKVIYLDSNFVLAHFGLFYLYQRIGNPVEAERHRTLAVHLASKLPPDTVLPGSDDLTAGQLLTMAQAVPHGRLRC